MPTKRPAPVVKPDPEGPAKRQKASDTTEPKSEPTAASDSGESSKDAFARKRATVHAACLAKGDGATIYQSDLPSMLPGATLQEMMELIQSLTNAAHLNLMQDSGGVACWQVRSAAQATAYAKLNREEHMIYSHIEEAGTAGIWTRTLQKRTNLHQQVVNRSLKALEASKHVKQIKSIKFPSRKIYMLYGLDPGEEVTGGPWFSEGELDSDLVDIVSDLIVRQVREESWRIGPKVRSKARVGHGGGGANGDTGTNGDANGVLEVTKEEPDEVDYTRPSRYGPMLTPTGRMLLPHPAGYQDYPTTSDLLTYLDGTGVVTGKDLTKVDLDVMLDMLCFDGKLEKVGHRMPSAIHTSNSQDSIDVDEDEDEDAEPFQPARNTNGTAKEKERDREDTEELKPEPMFRTVRKPTGEDENGPGNGFSEVPCSKCPVFRLCEDGGPVDAKNCAYFTEWLEPSNLAL